eukprot:s94_g16.t1
MPKQLAIYSASQGDNSDASDLRSGRRAAFGTARVGARASRVVRVLRLVRILKLYKAYYEAKQRKAERERRKRMGELEDDWDEADYEALENGHGKDTESRVGKKLSEMTTRRVICLILAMLLVQPLLSKETAPQRSEGKGYVEPSVTTDPMEPVVEETGANDDDERWEAYGSHRPSHSWQWSPQQGASYGSGSTYDPSEDEPWKLHTDELLPEFLQGWYLLIDAGLDSTSRNMIQTALKDDYRIHRVAQELRQQWPDEDLKKFDHQNKGTAYLQDEVDEADEDWPEAWAADDLTEEAQALFGAAEKEAQEAYAMIQQGRRTLREARARQHQTRLNRQYYKNTFAKEKPGSSRSSASSGPTSASTCLRCGKSHRTADCPQAREKSAEGHKANTVEEAPFVCFTEDPMACTAQTTQALKSTRDAVMSGYGVIDGGATRTLGSVTAIQSVMDINKNKYGEHGITNVDVSNKPTFGFGNSSQNQCISTAQLKIKANDKPGTLQIHALSQGQGPILISIDTLRKLKAVIDFSEDLMVLRALDDRKMIPLELSAAGHQLLPLTEDLMTHAMPCTSQVPSLRSFC